VRQVAATELRLGAAVIGEATNSCACFDDWLETPQDLYLTSCDTWDAAKIRSVGVTLLIKASRSQSGDVECQDACYTV
jgi:hypothetical protein